MDNNFANNNQTPINSTFQSKHSGNSFQRPVNNNSNKKNTNFGKSVLLPFASGILGATLALGVCFNVPSIKNSLIKGSNSSNSNSSASINYNNINTDLVSLSSFSDTGIAVAQKVLPSVVGINVEYSVNTIFSQSSSTAEAAGSGVIISTDGYILTNNHVVNSASSNSNTSMYYSLGEATKLTVTLYNDDTEYEAKIVGTDEQTDLAVIKIDKNDLTAASLGDSDSVQVGEWCMAVGNPLGMNSSVSSGSVSAVNRTITDSDGKKYTLIQTDAAINSGNSGGALVNSKGEVIGINTIKASGTGIEGLGFAIPINSTKSITQDLIQYKKVIRPYIGVTASNITENTIKANPRANLVIGCYIREVSDYSPAQKAGLKVGDIITKIDGKSVKTMDELNDIKNTHKVGDKISLTYNRDGKEETIELTLTEQP